MKRIWTTDEEAKRLAARFAELKRNGVGQAEFARDNNIKGGASMLSQHIKGRRPLNLAAATAYAKGFKCRLEDISPRLAKEAADAAGVSEKPILQVVGVSDAELSDAWPFELVDQRRYMMLAPHQKIRAQVRMNDDIDVMLASSAHQANGNDLWVSP